jgi:uncharacterized protein with HEPN domain
MDRRNRRKSTGKALWILRNRLRHAYHRIGANLLWQIADGDLPPLKAFIERVVHESD